MYFSAIPRDLKNSFCASVMSLPGADLAVGLGGTVGFLPGADLAADGLGL